jgi:hypothetical protein
VLNQYTLSDGCELVLHIYLFYSSHEDDSDTQSEVDTADLRSNITSLLEKITVTLSRDHMLACRSESGCEVPINIDEECEPYGMELKEQISAGTSSNQSTEYAHLLISLPGRDVHWFKVIKWHQKRSSKVHPDQITEEAGENRAPVRQHE